MRDIPFNYSTTQFLIPSKVFSELNQILFISILEQQDDCRMFNDEGKLDRYSYNYVSTLLFSKYLLLQKIGITSKHKLFSNLKVLMRLMVLYAKVTQTKRWMTSSMFNSKKKICPIAKNFVTVKTIAKVLFSILIQTRESVHGRWIPQLKPLLTQELKGPVKAVLSKVTYPKNLVFTIWFQNLIFHDLTKSQLSIITFIIRC